MSRRADGLKVIDVSGRSLLFDTALNKGVWDPKPRVTNIQTTNLKSLK